MIDWSRYDRWTIGSDGPRFVACVQETAVSCSVVKSARDQNVTFEIHGTSGNRVIGYVLRITGEPLVMPLGHSLGCFYSDARDTSPRRIETVLYHDQNTRLLAFGPEPRRDYLWVLRKR